MPITFKSLVKSITSVCSSANAAINKTKMAVFSLKTDSVDDADRSYINSLPLVNELNKVSASDSSVL